MSAFEDLSASQRLRAALKRDVTAVCLESTLGLEITKPAMDLILELIYKKLSVYASDLEVFARHARRCKIQGEDVKLLVRRNKSLRSQLESRSPTAALKRKSSLAEDVFEDASSNFDEPAMKDKMRKEEPPMEDAIDMTVENVVDLTAD